MVEIFEFKEKLKPFEKFDQELNFSDDKSQVYFELIEGNPKVLVSFLDDNNVEVISKEVPNIAFIKPYTNKAKLFVMNTSEKEQEVEYKLVVGVRRL